MQSETLIQSLIEQTWKNKNQAEKLRSLDLSILSWRKEANSWNVLECVEHLNLYGDFYLPQIEAKINDSTSNPDPVFKTGLLGNYFAESMLPKAKLNKMKTFKDKNPINNQLDKGAIDKFIKQQILLLDLLNASRLVSLNKVTIPTSISSLLRLKLGDTFRFFINHIIRHMAQMEVVLGYQAIINQLPLTNDIQSFNS